MHPNKRNILAIVAEMQRRKKVIPKLADLVRSIKHQTRTTLDDAITCFMPKINERQRQQYLHKGEELAKKFKRLGDARLREQHPDLHELWLAGETAAPVFSGGNQGAAINVSLSELKSKPALLARLNLLRKKQGLELIKTYGKMTTAQLEERIDKLEKAILKESIPPFKVLPAAVADGAYTSDLEAQHKTGHTSRGKTKAQEKHEKRTARHIEKRVKQDEFPTSRVASSGTNQQQAPKAAPAGSVVTLADIARELGIVPKVARQKARRAAVSIRKLEFNKQKYKFAIANKTKVAAILKG